MLFSDGRSIRLCLQGILLCPNLVFRSCLCHPLAVERVQGVPVTQPLKIFVTRRIPESALGPLRPFSEVKIWKSDDAVPRHVLLREAGNAVALLATISEKIDPELLDHAPLLKIVANMAVGYDNVDVPALTNRGVLLTNTPGVLTQTTADLVFGLVLGIARRLGEGERLVRSGNWPVWRPFSFLGADVHHATLGIIGLGSIGQEVAKRARGFSMRVLYHNRSRNVQAEELYGCEKVSLDTLLKASDFVVVLVPLNRDTRGLISGTQLEKMQPSAFLINVARGPVVDSQALYEALQGKLIAGAALDVTDPEPLSADHPLLGLENCMVVPHVGSASVATRARMAEFAAENIAAFLDGKRPPALVNGEAYGDPREE